MVAVQQQEAARLQSLIYSERAAIAHQRQMEMHLRQQSPYYPIPQAASASHMPIYHHSPHQLYPSYMHSSPFAAHGHPASQTAMPQYHPVDAWNHFAPRDSERRDSYEDPQRQLARSLSRDRQIAADREVVDRPRRSSSRNRALSPPTNASRFEAEVSSVSRRSTGGFSTRSSSAPRSPPRSRSQSRGRGKPETGGATIDPESEESKKAREKRKKQNIIELEVAKQERKSETARRKKQAFNAEMTEYFRSKALKTPEVAYSRRFDSIKEWKDVYLEAKAEAGAEERRAASPPPPPQVAADTESSYTGSATEELDRLFNPTAGHRTMSSGRASHTAAADPSFDRLRRSQTRLQGLAPEDAVRVLSRSSNAREPFEPFDDVSEQSSVVDADKSAKFSAGLRATSPARALSERQSAPAAGVQRRAASPVSPTPRQQYSRVRHRMQGEDASGLQTRDLFANMSLQSSVGEYEEDDISEALHFPPPPRSSQRQQQPLRSLSDFTPSPSKLQQYLDAAKLQVPAAAAAFVLTTRAVLFVPHALFNSQRVTCSFSQSPMHASFGPGKGTPPTLHRYATLV